MPGRPAVVTGGEAALALAALTVLGFAQQHRIKIFQLRYTRGLIADHFAFAFEGWNAISRVTVYPDHGNAEGVAPVNAAKAKADQYTILIDTFASTPIVKFDGIGRTG